MPVPENYVNIVEAAAILGVHWETVRRLCRDGRIPAEKVGNTWLIHKDMLWQFGLQKQRNGAMIALDEARGIAEKFVRRRIRGTRRLRIDKASLSSVGEVVVYDIEGVATTASIFSSSRHPFKLQVNARDGTIVSQEIRP
jgi:excisionase family DNA binding protein